MNEHTWSYCNEDGTVLLNGKLVAEHSVPGYVLLRRCGRTWSVINSLSRGIDIATVTCDERGCVMCTSNDASKYLIGAYLCGKSNGTYQLNVPSGLNVMLAGIDVEVPDGEILDEMPLTYGNTPILTHYVLIGTTMVGYGGLRRKLTTYRDVQVEDIQYVADDGHISTFYAREETVKIDGAYTGELFTIPGTKIHVPLFDIEEGAPFTLNIPKSMLALNIEALYYPYGPCGEMYWRAENSPYITPKGAGVVTPGEGGTLRSIMEREVYTHLYRGIPDKYVEVVEELLDYVPSAYKQSEQPILSALQWALAEKRGKL